MQKVSGTSPAFFVYSRKPAEERITRSMPAMLSTGKSTEIPRYVTRSFAHSVDSGEN